MPPHVSMLEVNNGPASEYQPAAEAYFGVLLTVSTSDGDEFDVMVCTPSWFAAAMQSRLEWGNGTLFVGRWDLSTIERALEQVAANAHGERYGRRSDGGARDGPCRSSVRHFISPDIHELATHTPDDPSHIGVLVQALVGPADEPGEESFEVMVVTPAWLEDRVAGRWLWGRHMLVADRWDGVAIEEELRKVFDNAVGADWHSVARYLARYGRWEFEDYRTP